MNLDLPTDYDAIILGTGMCESILAAALSRTGWLVLHLDRNDLYGADWSTFHFEALRKWIAKKQGKEDASLRVKEHDPSLLKEGEKCIPLCPSNSFISQVQEDVYIPEEFPKELEEKVSSKVESTESSKTAQEAGTDKAAQEAGTDKAAQEAGTDKAAQEADTDKAAQEAGTDKAAQEAGTDKAAQEAGTDKAAQEASTDEAAQEVGTDKAAQEVEIDKAAQEADTDKAAQEAGTDKAAQETDKAAQEAGTDRAANVDSSVPETEKTHSNEEEGKKDCEKKDERKKWDFQSIRKKWRQFNIDLTPRMLYCRGEMVELLISSDIAKYCEFRSVTRVLTDINNKLQQVPCSRSDVFSSKAVSMIEKRMLMKHLAFCLEYDQHPHEYQGFENKPFAEFLKSKKISKNVQHYIYHAIAMATEKTNTIEGLKSTQKFLQSLGRYGNTAFLWTLYGSGEITQSFCRVCAVFGGVYCLQRAASSLIMDANNKCIGVFDTEGQRLNAKVVVMETSYASEQLLPALATDNRSISRGILLTDRSLMKDSTENISLLSLPSGDDPGNRITVMELSSLSMACPKDIYVVHLTCTQIEEPKKDFEQIIEKYFQTDKSDSDSDERPRIMWSLFYTQRDTTHLDSSVPPPGGVYVTPGPDSQLDFDRSISQAREIFHTLCPDEEFLPKAPNPEDIIFDSGNQPVDQGSGFEPQTQEGKGGETQEEQPQPQPQRTEGGDTQEEQPQPQPHGTEGGDTQKEQPEPQIQKTEGGDTQEEQPESQPQMTEGGDTQKVEQGTNEKQNK